MFTVTDQTLMNKKGKGSKNMKRGNGINDSYALRQESKLSKMKKLGSSGFIIQTP